MGNSADDTAREQEISREDQDTFAITSYERSQRAHEAGAFTGEMVPIAVKQRGKPDKVVDQDEEITNLDPQRLRSLKPAFSPDGTVTAANASTLSDGASALVLASGAKLIELGLTPLAQILGFGDAAREPARFTLAPALAIPKALAKANLSIEKVDFFEVNEAFAVVALANSKILNLPADKVNVLGGGVSQGHPLGSSGSRIIVTLINILKNRNGSIGVASGMACISLISHQVCNGGGGASAIVIRKL